MPRRNCALPLYFSPQGSISHICHYMNDYAKGQCIGFNYWISNMEKKFSWGCQKYLHAFQQLWTNIGKYLSQSDFSLTRVNIQRKPSVTNWIKSNFMGNSLKKKKTNYSFDILNFLTLDEYFPILLSFNVLLVLTADNLQWHWMAKKFIMTPKLNHE